MGSVPNCRKEIPTRHAIRWFKCKLKPPNKIQCGHKLPLSGFKTQFSQLEQKDIGGHKILRDKKSIFLKNSNLM